MVGHLLNPSSLQGGFGDLAISGGIWGEKSPEKKTQNVFGDTLGVINDVSGWL